MPSQYRAIIPFFAYTATCEFSHGPWLLFPRLSPAACHPSSTFSDLFCLASLSPSLSVGFPFLPPVISSQSLFPSSLDSRKSTSPSALPLQTHPLSAELILLPFLPVPSHFSSPVSPASSITPLPEPNCISSPWLWDTNQSPGPFLPYREIRLAAGTSTAEIFLWSSPCTQAASLQNHPEEGDVPLTHHLRLPGYKRPSWAGAADTAVAAMLSTSWR